jgi:Icc-related predicted phosphoesterase
MKFIALSDTHGQHRSKKLNKFLQENSADVLLFAGDLQRNNLDDGTDFIDWLYNLPQKYKVITFGNHDGNFDYAIERAKLYSNIFILNNEAVVIDGIKIWGSPDSLIFLNWFFMKTDDELEKIYKNIPEDVDIIITHTPPFGIMDKTVDGILTGSVNLLNRLLQLSKLKYHIFGHIHECSGIGKLNHYSLAEDITFINASILNENYQLSHDPIMFEI